MTLRETLQNKLIGFGYAIYKVEVDRNVVVDGLPATEVVVYAVDGRKPHRFTFAKINGMSGEEMANVIKSYFASAGVGGANV